MWLMIDRRGQAWPDGSPQLREQLSNIVSSDLLRDFAVRNMGYVAVRATSSGVIVKINPALTTKAALISTLSLARLRSSSRAALAVFEGTGWKQHELLIGYGALSARLSREIGTAQSEEELARRPLSRGDLVAPLRGILEQWAAAVTGQADVQAFLSRVASSRFVFAEVDETTGEVFLNGVARDLTIAQFFPKGERRLLQEHPDVRYTQWIRRHYFEALLSGAPVFDEIDASIHLPDGQRRHVYTRLLLPIRRNLLLCATAPAA